MCIRDSIEGESFSLILVFLVGVVIVIFNRLHGLPANSVLAMFWASCVGNRLYRLTKRRNTSEDVYKRQRVSRVSRS